MAKTTQLLCGPVYIPPRILESMFKDSFSHRSQQYETVHSNIVHALQQLFGTKENVYIVTGSGTTSMEMAITNCFSEGDSVIVPITGNFASQFAAMCEAFGLNVDRVQFDLGETADPQRILTHIQDNTKGVLITHNESSTGVYNSLVELGLALKDTSVLLITDSVSGIGGLEMKMDDWGVDVVIAASQKCLMSPAGLSFISFSQKAKERSKQSNLRKYYLNLQDYESFQSKNQTPRTPAIYTALAVQESLNMILEEGIDNVLQRHKSNSIALISGLQDLGIGLFAKDINFCSPTLTCVYCSGNAVSYVNALAEKNILVSGGLKPINKDTFRIGTMGYVHIDDIHLVLNALESIKRTLN